MESLTSISSLLFAPISHQKRPLHQLRLFFTLILRFFPFSPKKKLVFTVVVKRCVCVSVSSWVKREESPPRPISARRPEPWPISDYYRLRERGECVFGPHTSSHVTLGQPTLFSHAQFSPPPESPTFDLGELENTDLDMNRLFFILLWLIDPLVWFFSDNYSLLQL